MKFSVLFLANLALVAVDGFRLTTPDAPVSKGATISKVVAAAKPKAATVFASCTLKDAPTGDRIVSTKGFSSQELANDAKAIRKIEEMEGLRMTEDIKSVLGKAKTEEESALKDRKPELMKQALQKVNEAKQTGVLGTQELHAMENDAQILLAHSAEMGYDYKCPAVNSKSLEALLKKEERVMVVFYAPWCPHCRDFVEQCPKTQEPAQAPLELFYEKMQDDANWKDAKKGIKIVKYDITLPENQPVPGNFVFQTIPSIFAAKQGTAPVKYNGMDLSDASLKAFGEYQLLGLGEAPAAAGDSTTI